MVISSNERIMRMCGLLGGARATLKCWLISWMHFSRIWMNSSLGTNWEGGGGMHGEGVEVCMGGWRCAWERVEVCMVEGWRCTWERV